MSMAPRPETRNGCLFCPLWRWRWTASRWLAQRGRLYTHTHKITPLKEEPPIREWTYTTIQVEAVRGPARLSVCVPACMHLSIGSECKERAKWDAFQLRLHEG